MSDPIYVYVGSYPTEDAAIADLGVVRDLYVDDVIRTYDSAILVKDDAGRVHVRRREETAKHPAWAGAAVGGLVDVLFTGDGKATGPDGRLWRDISREDLGVLGELMVASPITLVVVSTSEFGDSFAARLSPDASDVMRLDRADARTFERELRSLSGR